MRGIGENSIWIKRVFCKHSKYADQKPANSVTNLRQKFASQHTVEIVKFATAQYSYCSCSYTEKSVLWTETMTSIGDILPVRPI